MAIPFKIDHFRLRRQSQLERELASRPLFKKMAALAGKEWRVKQLKQIVSGNMLVPEGTIPLLDAAVLRMKTVARLPYAVRLYLRPSSSSGRSCIAFLDADILNIAIPPALLRGGSPATLAYHLARSTFQGLQHYPQYLALLFDLRAPFELEDRFKAYQILRLSRYAGNCFALVCCGSLDIAMSQGFSMATGVPIVEAEPASNLDLLAEHALKNTALNGGNILDDYAPLDHYEPIHPLVLRRFMESEPFRACHGETGGTTREQFESEVLEFDCQAYPPMDELPQIHSEFAMLASLLAAHWIMEVRGPVTRGREGMLLESLQLKRKRFNEIATQAGWRREGKTNTRQMFDELVGGREWKNFHCADIIRSAFVIAFLEHGGKLPSKVVAAFVEIGQSCRLESSECGAICEAVLEETAKETDTNE